MALPGQLDEVAVVPDRLEAQAPVKRRRPLDVPHEYLGDELLGWVDVAVHGVPSGYRTLPGRRIQPLPGSYRPLRWGDVYDSPIA